MTYMFRGAQFHVATPDGFVPRFTRAVAQSIEHIPYSDKDVVDIGGLGGPTVRCTIILLAHEVAAFEAQLGQTGELIWDSTIIVQATLTELQNARMNFDRTHFWCDAIFVQVT